VDNERQLPWLKPEVMPAAPNDPHSFGAQVGAKDFVGVDAIEELAELIKNDHKAEIQYVWSIHAERMQPCEHLVPEACLQRDWSIRQKSFPKELLAFIASLGIVGYVIYQPVIGQSVLNSRAFFHLFRLHHT
jgi:hypothetical protein